MIQSDKPQLGKIVSNPLKEPSTAMHALWVDVFELAEAKGLGNKVWIEASMEVFKTKSKRALKSKVILVIK
jgi:hypothetical protein